MNGRVMEIKPAPPVIAARGRNLGDIFRSLRSWIWRIAESRPRRLRLVESLPLGERRFVAVVEYDETRFLLGGTASTLVLLSHLADRRESPAPNIHAADASSEVNA